MTSSSILDDFRKEHRHIETELTACEVLSAEVEQLTERLKALRPMLLQHLDAKDAFYQRLVALHVERGDVQGAQRARSLAESAKVESDALRRFFNALDGGSSPLLPQSFKTLAHVIRRRLETEERAAFPLYPEHG